VLRFFENKTGAETAALLGIREWAAHKRAERAVEKLRAFFTKRGIVLPAAALTAAISSNSVQAAPVTLAKIVTAVAIAKGAAASGSTLTLIKGALKIMAWSKMKTAIIVGIAVMLTAGTTTVVVKKIYSPLIDEKNFWSTSFPSGMPTNFFGNPATFSFPITPVERCSISGLLDQCMQVSGNRYLVDKEVAAGGVKFGCPKVMNGEEWIAAFENALQTNTPEWWDATLKTQRQENLILIRYPKQKIVLVLPKDKAAKYQ